MNKDAIVVDGQKSQENVVPVETAAANDAMQKTGISETAGFASTKIKNMISAPDFRSGDGFSTTEEIEKRKNIAWAPEFMGQSAAYDEEFTSDTGTIIKDSVKQFGMSLLTVGSWRAPRWPGSTLRPWKRAGTPSSAPRRRNRSGWSTC